MSVLFATVTCEASTSGVDDQRRGFRGIDGIKPLQPVGTVLLMTRDVSKNGGLYHGGGGDGVIASGMGAVSHTQNAVVFGKKLGSVGAVYDVDRPQNTVQVNEACCQSSHTVSPFI